MKFIIYFFFLWIGIEKQLNYWVMADWLWIQYKCTTVILQSDLSNIILNEQLK